MAIHYATEQDFDTLLQGEFVIVDFFSTTCIPCKLFSKILEDLEMDMPFLDIVKVNTTEYPGLGERFEIRAVPTVHFYEEGKLVDSHLGVMPMEELLDVVRKYAY